MSIQVATQFDFDYIITGAGAAGLSLAHHLMHAGPPGKRLLLVDRAPKMDNDRTWCFWEVGDGPFEPIVFRTWPRVWFHGPDFGSLLDIAPYRYKMLRGIDFYRHMEAALSAQPGVTRIYGDVTEVRTDGGLAAARIDGRDYRACWAFNSIQFGRPPESPAHHRLLQHFKGWTVRATRPMFDPSTATLMDFRIDQAGDCRFCYVLPFDEHTALVEYTVFSPALLEPQAYDTGLRDYLAQVLRIDRYDVVEEEFGVIPMSDAPYPARRGPRVINIGTAGGSTKPSTGYTFVRIQRHCARIAQALARGETPPAWPDVASSRHALFDGVLLNVLARNRREGQRVFSELFQRNPPERVLRFLDERTSAIEDLQVMASTYLPPFTSATMDVLARRTAARLTGERG